jgi:tetratricopeptide (TPR) repeat protein
MRWLQTESILQGVFLGLMVYAGLLLDAAPSEGRWQQLAVANLPILGGLAAALLLSAIFKLREGFRGLGRPLVFLLFVLLDSPFLLYAGVLIGAAVGVYLLHPDGVTELFVPCIAGGAAVGVLFGVLRSIGRRLERLIWSGVAAAALAGGLLFWFRAFGDFGQHRELKYPLIFALQMAIAAAAFYLLTFAGRDDETEVEFGAVCACLAVALVLATQGFVDEHFYYILFVFPALLFVGYVFRVQPRLRVLKHAFRGLSFARVGRPRPALQAYRRALQLDPKNALAREGFWNVHAGLDLDRLRTDPQTLALVDLDLCMDRAGGLLVQGTPTPAQIDESMRLLDLVLGLRPAAKPHADYWRAVAHTHARQLDAAAADLTRLLDPAPYGPTDAYRQAVLFPAWQMALTLHDELRKHVGLPQLAQPGRRMEAIAAVERQLADSPTDEAAFGLKRVLYSELTEAQYLQSMGDAPPPADAPPRFDYGYAQQLGLALIEDDARWRRGAEFLRMAAHGQPASAPSVYYHIAQAEQRAGDGEAARRDYEAAKKAGRAVGPKHLADAERQAYFAAVKILAEDAHAGGEWDAAIENYHLFAESERSGVETTRTLAGLYEQKGDALAALRATEQGLVYNPRDKDLLERKDRYYYSVPPETLREKREQVQAFFDFDYCVKRTKGILDGRLTGPEWLDVASHLISLATVFKPDSLRAKVLQARVQLRYGEREAAAESLEHVRATKLEGLGGDEEEAYYTACQLLGDLYLEDGKPDKAVECLNAFRNSPKSGARTMMKLGEAYEQLGDRAKAVRCYQLVTAFDGNPLVYDARSAINRLQTAPAGERGV